MSIIKVENLYYRYSSSGKYVLNNISADFKSGSSYALLGKSGSGKTTLLSLLAGLDLSKKGSVFYNEVDYRRLDRDKFRAEKIGIVFQQFNLLHKYTAIENVTLAMEISKYKTSNNKLYVQELLEKIGIDKEKQHRKVIKLSGGEQQRVALARAVCHKPEIIIADEPTANLDVENRDMIVNFLTSYIKAENACLIMATHSIETAKIMDNTIELNQMSN